MKPKVSPPMPCRSANPYLSMQIATKIDLPRRCQKSGPKIAVIPVKLVSTQFWTLTFRCHKTDTTNCSNPFVAMWWIDGRARHPWANHQGQRLWALFRGRVMVGAAWIRGAKSWGYPQSTSRFHWRYRGCEGGSLWCPVGQSNIPYASIKHHADQGDQRYLQPASPCFTRTDKTLWRTRRRVHAAAIPCSATRAFAAAVDMPWALIWVRRTQRLGEVVAMRCALFDHFCCLLVQPSSMSIAHQ